MKRFVMLALMALSCGTNAAFADSINDAMIQTLEMQRNSAQRSADREATYGRRGEAYRWQQVADRLQSQIDQARATNAALDNAARQLQDQFMRDSR